MKILRYIKYWLIVHSDYLEKVWLTDEQKERVAIYRIRATLQSFGHDVSEMTDDDIRNGSRSMASVLSKAGLSVDEMGDLLRTFASLSKQAIGR